MLLKFLYNSICIDEFLCADLSKSAFPILSPRDLIIVYICVSSFVKLLPTNRKLYPFGFRSLTMFAYDISSQHQLDFRKEPTNLLDKRRVWGLCQLGLPFSIFRQKTSDSLFPSQSQFEKICFPGMQCSVNPRFITNIFLN